VLRVLLAVVQIAYAMGALAAGFQVNPIRIDLSAAHPSSVLTLSNPSQEHILVQAEAFSWRQTNGEDQLEPTTALVLNPPIFELPPNGRQLLRVGLRQRPIGGVEQTYRLWLSQLPASAAHTAQAPEDTQQGVKLLLRVSLPVFAASHTAPAAQPVWQRQSDDRLKLSNRGQRHLQLLRLRVHDSQGTSLDLPPRYVLGGSEVLWQLPPGWQGRQVQIEADSDAGPLHASLDASASMRP
jgi:fimbrial chaperone protein